MRQHWFLDRWIDITALADDCLWCEMLIRRALRERGFSWFDARAFAAWAVRRKSLNRRREKRVMAAFFE